MKQNNQIIDMEKVKKKAIEAITGPTPYKEIFIKETVIYREKNTIILTTVGPPLYCPVCNMEFFDAARSETILNIKCKTCKTEFYIPVEMLPLLAHG